MKVNILFTFLVSVSIIAGVFFFAPNLGPYSVIVLTLFVLLVSYLEYGKKLFTSLGFDKKNVNIKNLLIYAPITALVILLTYRFILVPSVTHFTQTPIDISAFDALRGNLSNLLVLLPFVWISAAFGEEIIFRGYLMTRFTVVFGKGSIATIFNILIFATFFGLIHSYQGITGQVLSGITGGIIATIFHFKKQDLWFSIVVHGMIDTLAFIGIYYGIF